MDIAQLNICLSDLVPRFEKIDGYLFVDRFDGDIDRLKAEISKYATAKEAQSWINIVLIESFIDEVVGDEWDFSDPCVDPLLTLYERSWVAHLIAYHPGEKYRIERLIDAEAGDLGLRLVQD